MAKRPRAPDAAEPAIAILPARESVLTADERLSPLFRSLREIDAIEEPEERRKAALDRLDHISSMALGRERTVKNGVVISDPDCNAACKIDEVAHRLMSIEPARPKPRAGELEPFERAPLALAK